MKTYIELVKETLDQRAIIDNRDIATIGDVNKSVMIAFNQACEYMRDLHKWKWLNKEEVYANTADQNTYPMPYGIVNDVIYQDDTSVNKKYYLKYVEKFNLITDKPTQWTYLWDTEEIQISPDTNEPLPETSTTTICYTDKNIATLGIRTSPDVEFLQRFDPNQDTSNQYLNVPEYIYDAYARCVILKARIFLNENAQTTVFNAQITEFQEAYNDLMTYAKTPTYKSERTVI